MAASLVAVAFFLVTGLAAGLTAFSTTAFLAAGALVEVVALVEAGLAFCKHVSKGLSTKKDRRLTSLAGADLTLGASLTFPEGPLGNEKIPSSAPLAIARLS